MKDFHIGDVLSITTGKLVSPRLIDGVYDILNYMTGDNLFTHQLPRAWEECAAALIEQFPQLAEIDGKDCNSDNWKQWLDDKVAQFGERLNVQPLAEGRHAFKDPITELEELWRKDRVITVKVKE